MAKLLQALENDEFRHEIGLKLLEYTRDWLRYRRGWNDGGMLPRGMDPEGIVCTVFEKVMAGDRKLNESEGLLHQLKGIVRSEVSNLFTSADGRAVPFEPAGDDGKGNEPVVPHGDEVGSSDYCRRLFDLLEAHPKVKSDENFSLILLAFLDGADSAASVATKTGIQVKRIYEYNRTLKNIYPSIKAKLNEQVEAL
jgi:hypothetical protein